MPLSPPVGRQHLHTRKVTCQGFYRDDGLFDIEGRITDTKTYEHANEWRGPLRPGDLVHDMSIRVTLDHRFTIVDVEAVTDSSPYRMCGDIAPNFKKLIGLRVGPGFTKAVRQRLGGVHGCTHLVELLGPVATTAFQTAGSKKANDLQLDHRLKIGKPPKPRDPAAPPRKPYMLDSCYSWASDSEVTKRWVPQFYTGPDADAVREAAKGKDIEMDG